MLPGPGGLTTHSGKNDTKHTLHDDHIMNSELKWWAMLWGGEGGGHERGKSYLTSSCPAETFSKSGNKKKKRSFLLHYQTLTHCRVINVPSPPRPPTNLFHQGLVLVWLAKVAADILCRDCALLAFAHPALVLFLLRETVPEDLKSLPYGLLAHWSHQRTTPTP